MSREGRPSGEAYVEFETEEDTTKGLEKDNEHLGSRYIEGTIYFLMSLPVIFFSVLARL